MNYNELNRLVNSKINSKELVEIFRYDIDDVSALGQIAALSKDLLCYRAAVDFSFDGYKIIRNKDVSEVILCDKNDNMKFISSIYRKENIFSALSFNYPIKSWNSLFEELINSKIAMSIECAFDDAIDYYFGWVIGIDNNIATLKCFDGSGYLFKDETKINLNFVSAVSIGDRYTEYMCKYVRSL